MEKIQEKILQTCSTYLKKEGCLVYSTCSILKEENENIINQFLKNNPEFTIEKINLESSNYFEKFITKDQFLQVYQNEKTDGFFICKLAKK